MHFQTKKKVQHCNDSVSDRSKQSAGLKFPKFPSFPLQVQLRSWLHVTRWHCRSNWNILDPWSREKKSWSKRYHARGICCNKIAMQMFYFCLYWGNVFVKGWPSAVRKGRTEDQFRTGDLKPLVPAGEHENQQTGARRQAGLFPFKPFSVLNISMGLDCCIVLLLYYL